MGDNCPPWGPSYADPRICLTFWRFLPLGAPAVDSLDLAPMAGSYPPLRGPSTRSNLRPCNYCAYIGINLETALIAAEHAKQKRGVETDNENEEPQSSNFKSPEENKRCVIKAGQRWRQHIRHKRIQKWNTANKNWRIDL